MYCRLRRWCCPLDAARVARVKTLIERFPTYGYRRLATLLGENRKPIQRLLQVKGWQVPPMQKKGSWHSALSMQALFCAFSAMQVAGISQ